MGSSSDYQCPFVRKQIHSFVACLARWIGPYMWRGLGARTGQRLLLLGAHRPSSISARLAAPRTMATNTADKSGSGAAAASTLKRDAPGWMHSAEADGPVCWKCRGAGVKPRKSPKQSDLPCTVCEGKGFLPRKKLKERKRAQRPLPEGYVVPGPVCAENKIDVDNETEELCALLGSWRILQAKKGGHRWSTDDLLTGWVACKESQAFDSIERHLDLGCGIGTVLQMVSWYLMKERADDLGVIQGVGVEAQSMSAGRAVRSIRYNGVEDRLKVIQSDFREVQVEGKFDIITGTPPYFPIETSSGRSVPAYGGMPTHEQSAPARFEFRGGLEAYVETAARFVKRPGGVIVLCEGNLARVPYHLDRVRTSAEKHTLRLDRTVMVRGRADKPALFAVHVLRPNEAPAPHEFLEEWFDVRSPTGDRTKQYYDMCLEMGIAPFIETNARQAVRSEPNSIEQPAKE